MNWDPECRAKVENWCKAAYFPTWGSIEHLSTHEDLQHTDLQDRVLHACLSKVFEGSEKYCRDGVTARDCNGKECHVVCRLLQYTADLMERYRLQSSPVHVSAPPCNPELWDQQPQSRSVYFTSLSNR